MYFHRKHSKTGRCLQLLESYRPACGGSPRHRVVASLGNADIPEAWWSDLAALVASLLSDRPLLLPPELPSEGLAWADRIVQGIERRRADELQAVPETIDGIVLDRVEHSNSTVLGPLVAGLHAWRGLDLDGLLAGLGFKPSQRQAACALVLGRLVEPMSEHAFHEHLPRSSFPDLLGDEVLAGGVQRYYRIGDRLFKHRDRIESAIRDRLGRHFGLERTLFLYDLTNFHFEGVCGANPKAARGKNKQKRSDCPQVVVGVVFDEFGFEVLHRTFSGNTGDPGTLPEMASELRRAAVDECLAASAAPTVVVDGGLATKGNLDELRRLGFHYLVNDKRSRRAAWRELFGKDGFVPVGGRKEAEQVLVRHVDMAAGEHGLAVDERIVLCKSSGRRNKELAIRSNAEERFLKDMTALSKRLENGRLKTASAAERALGRVLGKHPRVARFYDASIIPGPPPALSYLRDDRRWSEENGLAGCYALRSDRRDIGGEEIWRLYMTLCRAEDGFQAVKSDLGLRPGYHRIEKRVDTHVFITILAYQVLRFILHKLESHGDTRSWYTLRHILATHCYATIHLPQSNGRTHRIRKPGRPEACQWDIYRKIGIKTMGDLPTTRTTSAD